MNTLASINSFRSGPPVVIGIGANWPTFGWNSGAAVNNYYDATISDTGQYQMYVLYGGGSYPTGGCYLSTNYGASFAIVSGGLPTTGTYTCCRMSSTGQYVMVIRSGTGTYISSNYGSNFTLTKSYTGGTIACAVSASGLYMIAATQIDTIFYSSNYGVTWTGSTQVAKNWTRFCVNDSGIAIAVAYGDKAYYSSNYGANWTVSNTPATNWYGACMSSTGQYVNICSTNGSNYYSSNYGQTYTVSTGSVFGQAIACTPDGQYVIAGSGGGGKLQYSTNFGATWNTNVTGMPHVATYALAMNGSGKYILAGGFSAKLYRCVGN